MSKALKVKCAAEEELKQWWKLAPVGEVVWRRRGCQEQWGHCIEEELVVVRAVSVPKRVVRVEEGDGVVVVRVGAGHYDAFEVSMAR